MAVQTMDKYDVDSCIGIGKDFCNFEALDIGGVENSTLFV